MKPISYKKSFFVALFIGVPLSILLGIGVGLYHYWFVPKEDQQITDFNYARDAQQIIKGFQRDLYWLSGNPTHSTEYMLANRASSQKITNIGNLTIKVAYDHDQYAGMVAYFKKKFYVGKILFLLVEPEFRSKGWGYRLLDYAMKDLAKRGALRIVIVTRPENAPANKLYERYGFKEVQRDKTYVEYEYYPEEKK